MTSSVAITAPSRLHFGLFAVPGSESAPGEPSARGSVLPQRRFGGVGLMIDRPGVTVRVRPAREWSASGPCAGRALEFAKRFSDASSPASSLPQQAFNITVESCAPEHVGLGTGTQLGLAVAKALMHLTGLEETDAPALARRVGRGLRSSLGIHGTEHGGFLVEAGKTTPDAIAPLVARHDFPDEWRVLLIIPPGLRGEHGSREAEAFASVARAPANDRDAARTDALARLALLGMLPALVERDLPAFGEAVYEFNRRAGEWFEAWQGGVYAHPRVAELVAALRREGIRGAGQSSWGPAVFAIDEEPRLHRVRQTLTNAGLVAAADSQLCAAWRPLRPSSPPGTSSPGHSKGADCML